MRKLVAELPPPSGRTPSTAAGPKAAETASCAAARCGSATTPHGSFMPPPDAPIRRFYQSPRSRWAGRSLAVSVHALLLDVPDRVPAEAAVRALEPLRRLSVALQPPVQPC